MFYLFIYMSSPYMCAWRWSCNLLHGSRDWCRWAGGYVKTEWETLGDFH